MNHHDSNDTKPSTHFGPVYIIEPTMEHTHTVVLLHGRGSSGEAFAEDLMNSKMTVDKSLQDMLPGWRWLFPSSGELWSTAFQEEIPAWFEAHSLTDITARQDLQVDGLCISVRYVLSVIEDEIKLLQGHSQRVILGGISQGGAVGLWALLCLSCSHRTLGGFLGSNTWFPFASDLEHCQTSRFKNENFSAILHALLPPSNVQSLAHTANPVNVYLGHGGDDAYVDVELGRQVARILRAREMTVEWKEYSGAEEEGHWLKVPEQVDDMYDFLRRCSGTT